MLCRLIAIFANTARNPTRKLADGSFFASISVIIAKIVCLPATLAGSIADVTVQQLSLWLSILFVFSVIVVISEASGGMVIFFANTYNSGIGEMMHVLVISVVRLFAPLFRLLLPFYNAFVYITVVFWSNTFLPFVFVNVDVIPSVLLNLSMMASTLAFSCKAYVEIVVQCATEVFEKDESVSPFWVNDLRCVASPYAMTLDLMTPGIYMQKSAVHIQSMLQGSCGSSASFVTVLLYPLIDYNMYKAVHGAVNAVLHVFITMPLWTSNRCSYAKKTSDHTYTELEVKMMCVPDLGAISSILRGTLNSFGLFMDNFLDVAFVVVETAVTGKAPTCAHPSVQAVWQSAGEVFGTQKLQVVGLTRSLYAVTDGTSVTYQSLSGAGMRSSFALNTWPFEIDLSMGLAAVRYSEASDADDDGGERTGIFGCRCLDEKDGLQILCASVPYQTHLAEDEAENEAATVHRVRFMNEHARVGLTCATVVVRVNALRFSRRRFSTPSMRPTVEGGFGDPFDTRGDTGEKYGTSHAADASVTVMPLCTVEGSVFCMPSAENCYPFCMGLHAAGQSTQDISMMNSATWNEYTSLGQTDCVVSEADRACTTGTSLAVNDGAGVNIHGCSTTLCSPDAATTTFIKNIHDMQNRSLITWNANETWGFIRTNDQPFVIAGDIFLYQKETNERQREGLVFVTRLYDNKRGDFSLQQEQLGLVTNSDSIKYVECDTEDCFDHAILDNHLVLPDQFFTRASFLAAVSEWAIHWTAVPDLTRCSVVFDYCSATTSGLFTYNMHRPRIWTLRTVHSTDEFGKVDSITNNYASFMVIPDWFRCEISQNEQCQRIANMKVTALEYMNPDNLLLTVMAASPAHWDVSRDDIRVGMPFEYRYYFIHPNKHDCTSPGISDDPVYTCWREQSAGMYNASDNLLVEAGSLCPAMQRMPKWGSLAAELGTGVVYGLTMVLDLFTTLPVLLSVPDGMNEIFAARRSPTFQSMMDTNGARLFDFDGMLISADRAAFHAGNTLSRISMLFEDRPGFALLKPVLIATGRIYQYTAAQVQAEDFIMGGMSKTLRAVPIQAFIDKLSGITQSPPATPMAVTGSAGNTNLVQMFTSAFSSTVSWSKVTVKMCRKLAIKLLRRSKQKSKLSTGARDLTRILLVSAYDSEGDFKRNIFTSMRVVCDSAGQAIGRTNSWGQFVRHSCMILPDSLEAVLKIIFVLFVDYQVMDCVCKQPAGFNAVDTLQEVCLPRIMPMAAKAFVLTEIPEADPNAQPKTKCFLVMDSVNDKLLKVMDPVLSRMYKAQTALEGGIASLVSTAMTASTSEGSDCTDWTTSPFVVSILPEPVDYFMGCMETVDCRSRCLDPMRAFETSLNAYRAMKGVHSGFERTIDVQTNSLYFSTKDEFDGNHLAPFVVYSVILLEADLCKHVCSMSSQDSSRCVSVAGMDTQQQSRPQGSITQAYYCVPASVTLSVFRGSIPDSHYSGPMYADAALGDSVVTAMTHGTTHNALGGGAEWMVLTAQNFDTGVYSIWVMPPGNTGVSVKLLQTVDFHLSTYIDISDVNDARWNIQQIHKVFVLAASSTRRWMTVYVSATRTEPYMFENKVCVFFYIDTSSEGSLYDGSINDCSEYHDKIFSPSQRIVCLGNDCSDVLRVPREKAAATFDQLVGYHNASHSDTPDSFDWTVLKSTSFEMTANQRSILDMPDTPELTLVSGNRVQLATRQMSAIGKVDTRSSDGAFSVHIPMTGRSDAQEAWLQNIDIHIPPTEGGQVQLRVAASMPIKQRLEMVVNCSISSCQGCQGSGPMEVDLQNKCFAAASCGIAVCVGTPVNMQRPLCQMATLIGTTADVFRVSLASFWDTLSRTIIGIVELSAHRRKVYEVSWPAETVQMGVCNAKDAVIEFWAVFGAMVGSLSSVNLDNSASHGGTTMSTSKEARTAGLRVMAATAFVELMSHISMGVVYAPIITWKLMQCQLNSAFVVITGGGHTMRLGTAKFDKNDEAAIGMCMQEKIQQELRDMASPSVDADLQRDMSGVGSNIVSMISGGLMGPFVFVFDATCAWALGIIKGLMNVVQVLDWTNCKLPSIDSAVVSRCVCGDKAARIAQQQRDAKQTVDSLWCYGPLMLTDTTGNDVLIWNPYSLSEIFRMQERGSKSRIVEYLDCISMDRCNFGKLIPTSAGTMEDYILCLKEAPFTLSQKEEDEHCIRFQKYTDCIHEKVDCESLKPTDDVFEAQGVEVMQVITRCRNNYINKRWDEASVLLGLLEYNSWTDDIQSSVEALAWIPDEDYLSGYRRQMSKLSVFMRTFVDFDKSTWTCLQSAMLNKQWKHNCAELAYSNGVFPGASDALTFFEYQVTTDTYTFVDMDACQSFSGRVTENHASSLTYPKMVWDGDSANAVPVAEFHRLRQADINSRHMQAEQELNDLMQSVISPALKIFTEKKIDDIVTTFWSMEGDYIHQLVDCYILGPYAAADMLPAFKTSGHNFEVPQYHRGTAESREIRFDLHMSGSDTRRKLMENVVHHVSGVKDEILLAVVKETLTRLQKTYSDKRNLYCQCIDGRRSLACCMTNHDDLQSFGHTFAAQQVVTELKDSAPQFLQQLAHSISSSNFILRDIWTEDEFAFEFKFDGVSVQELAEDYMFNFEETIYHYDDSEIIQGKNHTLWSMCMSSLRASFFSMPVRRRLDDTLEVDVDTIFDPTETPALNSDRYLHGMEQFVERMLERSKIQSPVFWTHVHRYMPSDSAWCEGGAHRIPDHQRAADTDQIHTTQFNTSAVRAPHLDDVLYVAQAMNKCVCGAESTYSNDTRKCLLPVSLCDSLIPAPEDHSRWTALCLDMEYSTPSDFMFIRRVIEYSSTTPKDCYEYEVSTVWGLMDSKQHMQWYNGSHDDWKLSLHEIATSGPSGARLSDFLQDTPRDFGESNVWARESSAGIFNTHYEHTIAQPVCNQSVPDFLKRELSEHFRDVLFPMAHSVHEAPSHAVCGRWVVEYGMYVFLLQTLGNSTDVIFEQRAVEQRWRRRCQGQLEQVGICNLRGVYALSPNSSHKSAAHCPYTVPLHHSCRSFYVTDNCLLMCNGVIYDPCLCDGAVDCNISFAEETCASARIMLPPSSAFDLASMHWPVTVWPSRLSTVHQDLLDEVNDNMTVYGMPFYLDDDMSDYVLMHTDKAEGDLQDAFCDDLTDYMDPTAQHPVGYHPTTSCFKSETNMRGFTSWMTTGGDSAWSIDPVRVRNMSSYSTTLGSAHLTCDATVYGIRGHTLNNLFMESKWSTMSRADAAVPVPADRVSEEDMDFFGEGSMDAHDTPLQANLDSHLKFQHTVGLVRDWLRFYGDEDDNGTIQESLNELWPHWNQISDDSYGARPQDKLHDGCAMPPLFTCKENADCQDFTGSLQCLFMSTADDVEDIGICVSIGTCFRHSHCGLSQMCSGKGLCVDPEITVHNEHDRHVDLQLHALDSTQCRLPPYGLGKHQNIPSFAADNGLCGVRNFFNYNQTTYTHRSQPSWQRTEVITIPDHIVRPVFSHSSSRGEFMKLTDSQFPTLYSNAHECDRTYEHSDHKLCSPNQDDGIKVSMNSKTPSPVDVQTMRTWTKTKGDISINFCNVYSASDGVSEMLNPYKHVDEATLEELDTLIETRRDIKRCLDFDNICMQSTYTVRGSKVPVRLVTDVAGMREHQVKDVEMCMAFGVWNQVKEKCSVDRKIVSIFDSVYTDQSGFLPAQQDLDMLRVSCPRAFGMDYDDAWSAFEQLYIKIKNPYTTNEKTQMQTTVNGIVILIFDMAASSSKNRGIDSMQKYQEDAKCIKYLYARLLQVHESNALALSLYGIDKSQVPGSTLYLFSGTAPVEVTLLWFWKCVVAAKEGEGGVSTQWLRIMTSETDEGIQCDNVDMQSDMDMTLRRHLQLQNDIYIPTVDALVNVNIYTDILSTLEDTINFWDFYPVPTIFCYNVSSHPHCNTEQEQFGMLDTACGRIAAKDTFVVPDPLQNLNTITMVEIMTLFLFKRTRAQIEEQSGISINSLLADKLAVEVNLDTTLSRTINYTNAIPVFELVALNNMTTIIYEAGLNINQIAVLPASCTSDTNALHKSEYQILQTICEESDTPIDNEQSAMYRKIMTFRELTMSRKNFVYEDFLCYSTNNGLYASVSQKAAFILTASYLREILHASVKSKLGRLDADPDVRKLMWADIELSSNNVLHNRLAEAREYDIIMRARRFLCDKNKDYSKYQESSMQLKLRACTKSLKLSTGWQIPSKGNSLTLEPKSDFFLGGFFLTFSAPFSASGAQKPFVDELVDTPWHEPGYMYTQRQMCFKSTLGATRLSPLWSGNFDVQSCPFTESCGCETVVGDDSLQYLDITCDDSDSMLSCARDFPLFYSLVQSKMYPTCAANQRKVVPLTAYEQMRQGNLCSRRPKDTTTCSTHFGSLGGVLGVPVGDLHLTIPVRHFQTGLFANESKLLRGFHATDNENVNSIRMKSTDIGGNSLGFTVHALGTDGRLIMEVTCVSAGLNCRNKVTRQWLQQSESLWLWQHKQHMTHSVSSPSKNVRWSCPLQWISAYGDNRTHYVARSPSATRNSYRFRHITDTSFFAHAVVSTRLPVAQHPARFMSDASACADGRITSLGVTFSCHGRDLLLGAIQLHNRRWTTVKFHTSSPTCVDILDWPHRAFRTMDGANGGTAQDSNKYCNVFDRLPSFAVRYSAIPTDVMQKNVNTPSTAAGGACHMGRLKKFKKSTDTDMIQFCTAFETHAKCRVLQRNANEQVGESQFAWSSKDIPVQEAFVPQKRKISRKRKCNLCESHVESSFVNRLSNEMPLHTAVRQLSVGVPTSISPERLIAANLRRKICPSAGVDCPRLYDVLPRESWQKHKLMRGLLNLSISHQHSIPPTVHDDDLWNEPWVFCKRNNNLTSCAGVISKEEWVNPTLRSGACSREMINGNNEERKPIRLCDLSEEMQDLCVKLGTWNSKIEYILCKAAGHRQCAEHGFFYNPTAYSLSNQDFVYNTVRQMYHQFNDSTCPAVYVNKQELQNELLRGKCGSVSLEPLRTIVKTARGYAYDLTVILYCEMQIVIYLSGVIIGYIGFLDTLIAESSRNLMMFINLLLAKINSIMDRLMKMLWKMAEYGAFKWIKKAAALFCVVLEKVIKPLMTGFVHPASSFMADWITAIDRDLTRPLVKFINDITFGAWDAADLLETNRRNIAFWRKSSEDAKNFVAECEKDGVDEDSTDPIGVLPVATKCWSTYTTFFGDNSMLSCTAADTCHSGVTNTRLITCGVCPEPQTSFRKFGCFDVTKICTCSVPVLTLQYCTANEDCLTADSSCRYLDSELEPSIGFTPCTSCQSSRLCYMQPGMSMGYCACGLFQIKFARCSDHAKNVNPGYDDMCIFTSDSNFLQSVTFSFSFETTLSTPCRMINPSFSFCARESNGQLYVVGTDISRRRRLLQVTSGDENDQIETASVVCQDALASDVTPHMRAHCVALFHESRLTVHELGLDGTLPACAFCGLEDMFSAFVMNPRNMVTLTTNISAVLRVVARHTPLKHMLSTFKVTRRYIEVILHSIDGAHPDEIPLIQHTRHGWKVDISSNDTVAVFVFETVFPQVLNWAVRFKESAQENHTSRRLLSVVDAASDNIQAAIARAQMLHRTFQTQLSLAFTFPFESSETRSEWMSAWPPDLGRRSTDVTDSCPPLLNIIRGFKWTFGNLSKSFDPITMKTKQTLAASWVAVPRQNTTTNSTSTGDTEDVPTSTLLWLSQQMLQAVGLHLYSFNDLMKSTVAELPKLMRCNYESVQTCSRWDMHALHAAIIVSVYFSVFVLLCGTLKLSLLPMALLGILPLIVMYMSYGYSPFCAPMIPVCIMDDLLWTINNFLPVTIEFPASMFVSVACIPQRNAEIQKNCLRSCSDSPFEYHRWYDVMAWWATELDWAGPLETYAGYLLSSDDLVTLQDQLILKNECFTQGDDSLITGNRICAALSSYKAFPYLILLFLSIFFIGTIIRTVWSLLSTIIFSIFVLYVTAFY